MARLIVGGPAISAPSRVGEDGILTCHWHHARFDLASGCTFDLWADDVPTVTADEIRAHLAGKIAAWWMPDEIKFRDEMPLNATAKVDKRRSG